MEGRFLRTYLGQQALLAISLFFFTFLFAAEALSTPPHYKSIPRGQQVNYSYNEMDLLRVWIVYVGQGDGIIIQLPTKYNYDPDPNDSVNEKKERIDVLIDGGSFRSSNEDRMLDFLHSIYNQATVNIEYAVITHHDSDHIKGMTAILNDPSVSIHSIFHNGLASYRYKGQIKSAVDAAPGSIVKSSSGKVVRVLATLEADKKTIQDTILINDENELRNSYDEGLLHGIYEDLAKAILDKDEPQEVSSFSRVWEDSDFIPNTDEVAFKVIWPRKKLNAYSDWGQTINGNSVTFLLKYRNFEMLFTGDQNEKSEAVLVDYLKDSGNQNIIKCDVLKAPHHGSRHNFEFFLKPEGEPAIITVASMGSTGFNQSWKHPSTDVIKWAGGAHRFYSTYIHERRFKWNDMINVKKRDEMKEIKHILIETDGLMFRVVEVEVDSPNLNHPPSVEEVNRANGTRWIKAIF